MAALAGAAQLAQGLRVGGLVGDGGERDGRLVGGLHLGVEVGAVRPDLGLRPGLIPPFSLPAGKSPLALSRWPAIASACFLTTAASNGACFLAMPERAFIASPTSSISSWRAEIGSASAAPAKGTTARARSGSTSSKGVRRGLESSSILLVRWTETPSGILSARSAGGPAGRIVPERARRCDPTPCSRDPPGARPATGRAPARRGSRGPRARFCSRPRSARGRRGRPCRWSSRRRPSSPRRPRRSARTARRPSPPRSSGPGPWRRAVRSGSSSSPSPRRPRAARRPGSRVRPTAARASSSSSRRAFPATPTGGSRSLVQHEVAHVLVARAARGHGVPRWFDEGLAMAAGRAGDRRPRPPRRPPCSPTIACRSRASTQRSRAPSRGRLRLCARPRLLRRARAPLRTRRRRKILAGVARGESFKRRSTRRPAGRSPRSRSPTGNGAPSGTAGSRS